LKALKQVNYHKRKSWIAEGRELSSEPSTRATRILTESVYPWAGAETSTITQELFAGDRRRRESLDPPATGVEIERRDLRKRFRILPAWKKYQVMPLFDSATEQEKSDFKSLGRHWRNWREQTHGDDGHATRELKIVFNYQPMAEEQVMFGCVARHWIVRRRDECDRGYGETWTEAITDVWYLDTGQLSARFAGFSGDLVHHAFVTCTVGNERAVINHSGERPTGLCALSETKSLQHTAGPGGEVQESTETSSVRVISIREVSVPLSVFEPPKGFRKIPLYPNRFTMTEVNLSRRLKHFFRMSA
jgi:hypothetical protein